MSSESAKTPFEWLQGGLFFGTKSAKGGIESIDSSKDALSLLTGLSENLNSILEQPPPAVAATTTTDNPTDTTTSDTEPSSFDFLAARVSRLRFLLYDERRQTTVDARRTAVMAGTAAQGLTNDHNQLLPRLLQHLEKLPFESRKHVSAIFNYLLVSGLEGNDRALYQSSMQLFCGFVETHFEQIMDIILQGHETTSADVVLHCGSMYRSCLRHPSLYQKLVESPQRSAMYVYPFLDTYVHLPNFEIASDAMESLRAALAANGDRIVADEATSTRIAAIAAEFLNRDYEEIWDARFNPKLLSESANYMTRRVALQILSTVLLTRSNYAVMIRYVASRANLIFIMKLLRDTSPHITLDAFHVFKVFVANPNKPPEVVRILKDNKVKLCAYLQSLHQEKEDTDTQFRDEKALIVQTINGL